MIRGEKFTTHTNSFEKADGGKFARVSSLFT